MNHYSVYCFLLLGKCGVFQATAIMRLLIRKPVLASSAFLFLGSLLRRCRRTTRALAAGDLLLVHFVDILGPRSSTLLVIPRREIPHDFLVIFAALILHAMNRRSYQHLGSVKETRDLNLHRGTPYPPDFELIPCLELFGNQLMNSKGPHRRTTTQSTLVESHSISHATLALRLSDFLNDTRLVLGTRHHQVNAPCISLDKYLVLWNPLHFPQLFRLILGAPENASPDKASRFDAFNGKRHVVCVICFVGCVVYNHSLE